MRDSVALIMNAHETLKDVISGIDVSPDALKSVSGKIFLFKPSDSGSFFVEVGEGGIGVHEGDNSNPNVTISGTDTVLADVISGRTDAVAAFLGGKIKVSGDVMLAQKIVSLLKKK